MSDGNAHAALACGMGGDAEATAESFRPVVVAPTYNNAGTLLEVLGRITGSGGADDRRQ